MNTVNFKFRIIIFICFLFLSPVYADTVFLKNGTAQEGKIMEKNDDHVKIVSDGMSLTFYWDEIDHVEKSAPPAKVVPVEETAKPAPQNEPVAAPETVEPPQIYELTELEQAKKSAIRTNRPIIFLICNPPIANVTPDSATVLKKFLGNYQDQGILVYAQADHTDLIPNVIFQKLTGGPVWLPVLVFTDSGITQITKFIPKIKLDHVYEIPMNDSPVFGKEDAPVTVVMFTDFQCPSCTKYYPTAKEFVSAHPDQVRLVTKHYPLSFHEQALGAAKAALAAGQQGKFYEMAELLYNSHPLSTEKYTGLAKQLGLDLNKFSNDFTDANGEYEKIIKRDIKLGNEVGVLGTPTFYMNGRKIDLPSEALLKDLLDPTDK